MSSVKYVSRVYKDRVEIETQELDVFGEFVNRATTAYNTLVEDSIRESLIAQGWTPPKGIENEID